MGSTLSRQELSMRYGYLRRSAGFTLMEILITVAILAIITGIAVPVYKNHTANAKNKAAILKIQMIELSISMFQSNYGRFPSSLAELGDGNLLDPWGNPYKYLNIADDNPSKGMMRKDRFLVPINSDYDLYSMGADGKSASPLTSNLSHDDIVRANNGGYLGLGSDY